MGLRCPFAPRCSAGREQSPELFLSCGHIPEISHVASSA